ncbi:hypothetical protein BDM02DRAFT_3186255 [Thelephora ganbajun]|uniref:Uncharacterized protein n=1 Tax=Thelephora ganbajun TaxID=370292 RepID=A0ACB6ZI84_THEGA|nr:hypothetical protein BDM02DRAFT_3186255 [Thelephora ganbajun]
MPHPAFEINENLRAIIERIGDLNSSPMVTALRAYIASGHLRARIKSPWREFGSDYSDLPEDINAPLDPNLPSYISCNLERISNQRLDRKDGNHSVGSSPSPHTRPCRAILRTRNLWLKFWGCSRGPNFRTFSVVLGLGAFSYPADNMDLPQETIDEVIDNLAFDFGTLKSTSLVRKSWTHRSRRRLFYFLTINSLDHLEQWSASISSDPTGIASYPRVIRLFHDKLKSWVEPANLERFYDHFRSFSGVERLVIAGLETAKFDAISTRRYFGNFAATVRSLDLRTVIGAPASLASFICAFPLVDDLTVKFPSATAGGGNQGEAIHFASSPSFKGKLWLLDMFHESDPLVELLCTHPLSFHTVWVSSRDVGRLPQLAKLVNKCGKTLRSLHITRHSYGMTPTHPPILCLRLRYNLLAVLLGPTGASLTSCIALEELRITVIYPKHLVTILGEILPTLSKTTNLSRIILDADGSFLEGGDVDEATWNSLDVVMSEYAEKTTAKDPNRRLTLQFRIEKEGATGKHDGWARELVRLLGWFPKVGDVEYIPKH